MCRFACRNGIRPRTLLQHLPLRPRPPTITITTHHPLHPHSHTTPIQTTAGWDSKNWKASSVSTDLFPAFAPKQTHGKNAPGMFTDASTSPLSPPIMLSRLLLPHKVTHTTPHTLAVAQRSTTMIMPKPTTIFCHAEQAATAAPRMEEDMKRSDSLPENEGIIIIPSSLCRRGCCYHNNNNLLACRKASMSLTSETDSMGYGGAWSVNEGEEDLTELLLAGVTRIVDKFITTLTTFHEVESDLSRACTGSRIPKISIKDYTARIIMYINRHSQEREVMLHRESAGFQAIAGGLVLLTRCAALDVMDINPSTIHRAFLVCCLLANKIIDDDAANNFFWSRVGGISVKALNTLEVRMCEALRYRLDMSGDFEMMVEDLTRKDENIHVCIGDGR